MTSRNPLQVVARETSRQTILLAEKLGVKTGLLYRWKSEHLSELEAAGGPVRGGSSPTEMAAEIDRLRKDLAKAGRINQILKKTVSYFAQEE